METFLFIGGPADGEWRAVNAQLTHWRVLVLPEVRYDALPDPSTILQYEEHIYYRKTWCDNDAQQYHTFYVHESVEKASVFALLVKGYRRPK